MNGQQTKKLASDFLFVLNAAITNIRLYPPTSGIIIKSVDRMQKALAEAFMTVPELIYAESEKNLLVMGEPLPEKEQQRPQVRSFLSLMLDLGIKSVSFQQGIEQKEITGFLQVVGKPAEAIEAAGGLTKLMADYQIAHIAIDKKVYIERDSDQRILAELDISDEAFARYLTGEESVPPEVMDQIREMASNPDWFARVIQYGIQHILEEAGALSQSEWSEKFGAMMDALQKMSDRQRPEISRMMLDVMLEMDDDALAEVLVRNPDNILESGAFEKYIQDLDENSFKALLTRLDRIQDNAADQLDEREQQALEKIVELMHQVHQQGAGAEEQSTKQAQNPDVDQGQQRLARLKKGLSRILKGDTDPFTDPQLAQDLPNAVMQLMRKGKQDSAEALMDRMGEALSHRSSEVRQAVAGIMAEIDKGLASEKQIEQRLAMSKKLAEWVKLETAISNEYQAVTQQLESLAQELIQEDRTVEGAHILEAYHLIQSGNLEKDEAIAALAGNMLQNLSTDYILDILLQGSEKGERPSAARDIYSLVILGSTTVERLLDRLHDSQNMSERNRIIQAITQMGSRAVPSVVERLGQEGPWYYIRNLVLLLGRLGDEQHLGIIEPLLRHSDYRVQREAIKSVQAIGNEKAGQALLKNLDDLDPQLISYVISVFGALQYEPAAPYLIDIIKSRQLGLGKAEREEIREKACEALGRIKAQEAIAPLEQIVRAKGFFRTPPEKVRSAAAKALANIKRG